MTIIVHVVFICDMCDRLDTHSEKASSYDEVETNLDKLVPGWTDVWGDEDSPDLVCGGCFDRYSSLIIQRNLGSYYWISRPNPEKM